MPGPELLLSMPPQGHQGPDVVAMSSSPQFTAMAPSMTTSGALSDVLTFISTLAHNFNFLQNLPALDAAWSAGGLPAQIALLVANADAYFPDPTTRPGIVGFLQLLARLNPFSAPSPVPSNIPTPVVPS